jgi:signal peptidase
MNLFHRRPAPVPAGATSVPGSTAAPGNSAGGTPAEIDAAGRRTGRRRGLLRRIGGTLLTVVMALTLIVFVAMTVLRISGGELLAIRTGSMTPMMQPGDLLISRDVDPRTVRRGDVITFRVPEADNTLVTHRVTKVDERGNSFTTKGDANDTVDPFTTTAKDVLGARWFSIPKVGRLMVFLSSGLGTALLIGIPAAIYLGQTLADRRALLRARAAAEEPGSGATDAAADASTAGAPAADATTPDASHVSQDVGPQSHEPAPAAPPPFGAPSGPASSGPPPFAPHAGPSQWGMPPWGAPQWGAPQWGGQVPHVMPAAPPQVIVLQVPHPAPAPVHVPPPYPAPTPPPFRGPTDPSAPWPSAGPAPIAVATRDLPEGLTRDLAAEWVLLCPIDPSVAAHLRQRPRSH